MRLSTLRLRYAALAPARIIGCTRVCPVARPAPVPHATKNNNVRSFVSSLAQRSSKIDNVHDENTASSPIFSKTLDAALGTQLQPSDMLSYLNSEDFCVYRSTSDPSQPLFGKEERLVSNALTHESWMHGLQGHNRRLSFIGRRALKTYLTLFLFDIFEHANRINAQAPDLKYLQTVLSSQQDIDDILATHHIGDHVGRKLGLEKVMRWHPTTRVDPTNGTRESGLFKVRGTCVEAIMGAIYHFRGALVAQQFFLSRILPTLADSYMSLAPRMVKEKVTEASRDAAEALTQSA